MAAGETRTVGRVAIRVIPDSRSFRSDLKKAAERVERSVELKVAAEIDASQLLRSVRSTVREINAALANGAAAIKIPAHVEGLHTGDLHLDVDADTSEAERKINHLDRGDVEVPVKLRGLARVREQLRSLHNRITVDVVPRVRAGALSRVQAAAQGVQLAGATRLAGSASRALATVLNPATLSRIGLLTLSLLTAGAAVVSLSGSILSIAGSLASGISTAAGAAALLPGVALGVSVAAATIGMALTDLVIQVPDVVDEWKRLKLSISDNFWDRAATPLRRFVRSRMPEVKRSWSGLASDLGGIAGRLADTLDRELNSRSIRRFFTDTSDGALAAEHGLAPLTAGLRDLVLVGTSYLPRLGRAVGDIASRFGTFLSQTSASGQMRQWVDAGISALRDLGGVISGLGGTVLGILRAAQNADGGTLAGLRKGVEDIEETVNSRRFQSGLTRFFQGGRKGFAAFTGAAGGGVERLLVRLGGTLEKALPRVGKGLGELVGGVADLLADPRVQAGLLVLLTGISKVASILGDALPGLAPQLGLILTTVAAVLPQVASAIVSLLPSLLTGILGLAQSLPGVVDAVTSLIPLLEPLLTHLPEIVGALLAIQGAMLVVNAVMLAAAIGPWGLLAVAVAALAGGITAWALKSPENKQKLVDFFDSVAAAVKRLVDMLVKVAEKLSDAGGAIGSFVGGVGDFIVDSPIGQYYKHAAELGQARLAAQTPGSGSTVNIYNPAAESSSRSLTKAADKHANRR